MSSFTKKIAVYPGTFDPIHNGHIHILERSKKISDEIILAIAENKEKNTLISHQDRLNLAKEAIAYAKLPVKVLPFKGLLVDFVKSMNAAFVIRGMRNFSDFEYEFQMFTANKISADVETIFLMPFSNNFVSSMMIKEIHKLGGDIKEFVPENVFSYLQKQTDL